MTDLERFGKHVGSQDAVEFHLMLRSRGWEWLMQPPKMWDETDATGLYYRFGYVKSMSTAGRALIHLVTAQ